MAGKSGIDYLNAAVMLFSCYAAFSPDVTAAAR